MDLVSLHSVLPRCCLKPGRRRASHWQRASNHAAPRPTYHAQHPDREVSATQSAGTSQYHPYLCLWLTLSTLVIGTHHWYLLLVLIVSTHCYHSLYVSRGTMWCLGLGSHDMMLPHVPPLSESPGCAGWHKLSPPVVYLCVCHAPSPSRSCIAPSTSLIHLCASHMYQVLSDNDPHHAMH